MTKTLKALEFVNRMKSFQEDQKIMLSFEFQLLKLQWRAFQCKINNQNSNENINQMFNLKYFYLITMLNFVTNLLPILLPIEFLYFLPDNQQNGSKNNNKSKIKIFLNGNIKNIFSSIH